VQEVFKGYISKSFPIFNENLYIGHFLTIFSLKYIQTICNNKNYYGLHCKVSKF
jgi:hypothetical protein